MGIFYLVLFWNIILFLLFGIDKYRAKNGNWRIPERFLLRCALAFGSVGAFLGMRVFRHKTLHNKFRIGLPLMLVLHIVIVAALIYGYLYLAR